MGRRARGNPDSGAAQGSTLQKDEILRGIVEQMVAGTWKPYRSVRELAMRLDMSLANGQKYVAEAARLLRMSWGGDDAKVALIERISRIGQEAEVRTEEVLDAAGNVHTLRKPDHRSALKAAETLANILGMQGTSAEVVIRYQQMSDKELWSEATRFAAQLTGATHDTTGEELSLGDGGIEPEDPDGEAAALDRIDARIAGRGR